MTPTYREILTYPLTDTQFREEFAFLVQYFTSKRYTSCSLIFGWAWNTEYYGANDYEKEEVPLSGLESKVAAVEASGIGVLGNDNLYISLAGLHFRFCDDSDIHMTFDVSNDDVEFFYSRWRRLGYRPAQWLKTQSKGPGECERFN